MPYAVILAGGAGTRLWPLSRLKRPKQLIPLLAGKSLLELGVERLKGLFEPQDIWIITNAEYADQVAASLPMLPRGNIVGEPVGRDTANAIALAAEMLALRDPNATMAVFTADHVIRPVDSFARTVRSAIAAVEANPDALLTFGIRPNWPHTGLGYVHCGRKIEGDLFQVSAFKEKPDHHTARRYVESGEYFWNSGMFVWKLAAIRQAIGEFLPESQKTLEQVVQAAAGDGAKLTELLKDAYPQLARISIDFAVMEKARKVLMVELKCEWLDVGSWPALESVSELDESGNIILAKNSILLDCLRNIVVCEDGHLLALVGVDDCIVVHSPDATLVCGKSDAQRLKELVGQIEKRFGTKFT
jgi:mannose-1-phosphate guanylyltransferase